MIGLILGGGKSSRFGEDKLFFDFLGDGVPQWQKLADLLQPYCTNVLLSVGSDSRAKATLERLGSNQGFEFIPDASGYIGPTAGMLAAHQKYPDEPILVVACDLPLFHSSAIELLIAKRRALKNGMHALAFSSTESHGFPEPLGAIYESSFFEYWFGMPPSGGPQLVLKYAKRDDDNLLRSCPRKLLLNCDTQLIDQPDGENWFANMNYRSDLQQLSTRINEPSSSHSVSKNEKKQWVNVKYFAYFSEMAGSSEEQVAITNSNLKKLYEDLGEKYNFPKLGPSIRFAVNENFQSIDFPIKHGDTIAFIPPVSGG